MTVDETNIVVGALYLVPRIVIGVRILGVTITLVGIITTITEVIITTLLLIKIILVIRILIKSVLSIPYIKIN